jgi:hypothetical protein
MGEGKNKEDLSKEQIMTLRNLRRLLLHLHKSLLKLEQQDFEKTSGRVTTGELLQLVINHSQFAWLRMISALVVEIDEVLNGDQPATPADLQELLSQARSLLTSPANEDFRTRYQTALQREPSVVMAHSAVMQLLRQDH